MGEAKRKRKALKQVTYRQTATVLAFPYTPDRKEHLGFGIISGDALWGARCPSIFRPDGGRPVVASKPTDIPCIEELRSLSAKPEPGSVVVIDGDTLSVREIVPRASFHADHEHVTWTAGSFCRKGGESVVVDRHDDDHLLRVDGQVVSDLPDFLRGRIREVDGTLMACDDPIAIQTIQIARALLQGDHKAHATAHLAHLHASAVAIRSVVATSSAGAVADLEFLNAFMLGAQGDGPHPIPEGEDPFFFAKAASDWVWDYASSVPATLAARTIASAIGDTPAIFKYRADDDPQVWTDYDRAVEELAAQLGDEIAIGEGAVRTSLEIGLPAVKPALMKIEALIARGRQLARLSIGPVLIELVDLDNCRYLTWTKPNELKEIVGWTIAKPN